MYDWTNFDVVFGKASKWAYDQNIVQTISRNRQALGGLLFFDRIWASIGLKECTRIFQPSPPGLLTLLATKQYPPKSNQDLRRLFTELIGAASQDYQKQALVYYIIKDCKAITDHGGAFAQEVYLPKKYASLISGLHHLDHGQPKQALEFLTDPSLPPAFSDEILLALLESPKLERALPTAYYLTVLPPLADEKTLNAFFSHLCEADVTFAYTFSQKRAGFQRRRLFEKLILTALSRKKLDKASLAEQLISLPFTDEEIFWFEEFLIHGQGSSCHEAKDTVIMRRIATGQDCSDISRHRGQKAGGTDWGVIQKELALTR